MVPDGAWPLMVHIWPSYHRLLVCGLNIAPLCCRLYLIPCPTVLSKGQGFLTFGFIRTLFAFHVAASVLFFISFFRIVSCGTGHLGQGCSLLPCPVGHVAPLLLAHRQTQETPSGLQILNFGSVLLQTQVSSHIDRDSCGWIIWITSILKLLGRTPISDYSTL